MKYATSGSLCCAALLTWGLATANAARGDDWLSGATEPSPPRFSAARYQDDLPADLGDKPTSRLRVDSNPEQVPAPTPIAESGAGTPLIEDFGFEDFGLSCSLFESSRVGQFVVGAEYLNVRPNFSEATAIAEIRDFAGDSTQTLVQYDFAYQAMPRVYIGYRRADCDAEIRFTYTNFSGDSEVSCGPVPNNLSVICAADPELQTGPGESIVSNANVNATMYDIDIGKGACLNGPVCCADGCNTACARPCSPWDVTYWFGVRIADVDWTAATRVFRANDTLRAIGSTAMTFTGAGPRVGINARRYFGQQKRLSIYARGNIALLLGSYEITSKQIEYDPSDVDTNMLSRNRVIPVTEIELGISLNVRRRTTVSAGYMLQAWHDLGMSQSVSGQFLPYDDANILSFDGLFVRGEWAF